MSALSYLAERYVVVAQQVAERGDGDLGAFGGFWYAKEFAHRFTTAPRNFLSR